MPGDVITLEEINCSICQESYLEDGRNPRTLMCGHTFCTVCLHSIFDCGRPVCPECRKVITFSRVESIPICYLIKKIVNSIKEINIKNGNEDNKIKSGTDDNKIEIRQSKANIPCDGVCLTHDSPKHLFCKGCLVWVCGTCAFFKHCKINGGSQSKCYVQLSQDFITEQVNHNSDKVLKQIKILVTLKKNLKTINYMKYVACLDDKNLILSKNEFVIMSSQSLQDVLAKEKNTIEDVRTFSTHVQLLFEAYKFPRSEEDLSSDLIPIFITPIGELKNYDSLSIPRILFSCTVNGSVMHSAVERSPSYAMLPSLKSKAIQPDGRFIFHLSELRSRIRPLQVFFEVKANDLSLGVIVIQLYENQRSEQFRMMCTGECGPCYKGTRFFRADGIYIRCLTGGDYEFNDGRGGNRLFNITEDSVCNMEEGIVCGNYLTRTHTLAQFKIFYHVPKPGYPAMGPIGKVVKGMKVLDLAVLEITNKKDVTISECGLYFPINRECQNY